MVPGNNGFCDSLPELTANEHKHGGSISFLTKKQRLEMQLNRLEEQQKKIELARQKRQADLMLLEDENSDEDFFQYKITHKDWEILQKAKAHEGAIAPAFGQQNQFGLMDA